MSRISRDTSNCALCLRPIYRGEPYRMFTVWDLAGFRKGHPQCVEQRIAQKRAQTDAEPFNAIPE